MFENVVVGYDGSDPSVRALELGCALGKFHNSEIHFVHTPEAQVSEFSDRQSYEAEIERTIRDASEIARAIGVSFASVTIGKTGPVEDILEIAQLYDAQLIVTGRRGLGSVSGLLLGSTSHKLAQGAKCACMTVA